MGRKAQGKPGLELSPLSRHPGVHPPVPLLTASRPPSRPSSLGSPGFPPPPPPPPPWWAFLRAHADLCHREKPDSSLSTGISQGAVKASSSQAPGQAPSIRISGNPKVWVDIPGLPGISPVSFCMTTNLRASVSSTAPRGQLQPWAVCCGAGG